MVLEHVTPKVTAAMNSEVLLPFTNEEIKYALFHMHPMKAPGPDNYLGVSRVEYRNRYLGLPIYVGKAKKVTFAYLKDRLWKKLNGWRGSLLSSARKEILIKTVAQAALIDTTDREIYECLTCCYVENYEKGKGAVGTQLVGERAQIILDEVRDFKLFTRHECLEHIGEHFQPLMGGLENERPSVVGDAVIMNYLLVHLNKAHDKFNLLIFMVQKLFSLVDQTSVPDNPDSLQNHEVLLPGHLITIYLKEKLEEWLQRTKKLIEDEINKNKDYEFGNVARVKKLMDKNPAKQISLAVENMLETGRLNTPIWSRFAAEGRLDGSVREA
ncbi:DNA-directed RNA polymerase I subunit 2 [Malus domestica]|uniref:DNA-directed RNA polymerase I subunit 2 n=1 Tax=Malus domestica TaxID=3750 RepID=UPI003976F497